MQIVYKLILLLIFFLFILFVEIYSFHNPLYEHQHELRRLLWKFDSICTSNNINYVAAFGTALGSYRHRDIIPFDDDIDVAMTLDDYQRFEKLVADMDCNCYTSIYGGTNSGIRRFSYSPQIFIDIFIVEYCSVQNRIVLTGDAATTWPDSWFDPMCFESTGKKREAFGTCYIENRWTNVSVWIPSNTEEYLQRLYGSSYFEIRRPFAFHTLVAYRNSWWYSLSLVILIVIISVPILWL